MNALMLFSYATLDSLDEVRPFYEHIFRGPISEAKLTDSQNKFRSLATPDPLSTYTHQIGKALTERLERLTSETWCYYIGNKHISPFVDEAVEQCINDGATNITTLALTPFFSASGTQMYERQVIKKVREMGATHVTLKHVPPFYNHGRFLGLMQDRLQEALDWLPENVQSEAEVIFTAHSMPGTEKANQTFIEQYSDLAEHLAKSAQVNNYHIAYRSASPGAKRWLGPDVLQVIDSVAERGVKAIVVSELLSVIANSEAMHEIGKEARKRANQHGIEFVQTQYLNDSFSFIMALSDHIVQTTLI